MAGVVSPAPIAAHDGVTSKKSRAATSGEVATSEEVATPGQVATPAAGTGDARLSGDEARQAVKDALAMVPVITPVFELWNRAPGPTRAGPSHVL